MGMMERLAECRQHSHTHQLVYDERGIVLTLNVQKILSQNAGSLVFGLSRAIEYSPCRKSGDSHVIHFLSLCYTILTHFIPQHSLVYTPYILYSTNVMVKVLVPCIHNTHYTLTQHVLRHGDPQNVSSELACGVLSIDTRRTLKHLNNTFEYHPYCTKYTLYCHTDQCQLQ